LYYDDKHNANSIALPQWKSVAKDVKKVVFDKSFAKYKPKTTARWFEDFAFVTEFSGIENLKTDEVKEMTAMFKNCLSLTTIDLSGFDTKNVEYMGDLFSGCINLTTIFASDKWTTKKAEAVNIKEVEILNLEEEVEKKTIAESGLENLFQYCFKLCGSKGTKFVVFDDKWSEHVAEYKYAKIDGGVSAPGVFTRKGEKPVVLNAIAYNGRPYVVFDNGVLTFYFNNQIPQNACIDYSYLTGYSCNPFAHHVTKVVFDKSFEQYWPTSCDYWFSEFINLKEIVGLQYLRTEGVTSMQSMFSCCESLKTLDLSTFDTGEVRTMSSMFTACYNLTTIYVSDKWTTRSIANYSYASPMFEGCVNLVGGNGTKYERPEEGYRYYAQGCYNAKIDGGIIGSGYLTKKE
jgi:surface protein